MKRTATAIHTTLLALALASLAGCSNDLPADESGNAQNTDGRRLAFTATQKNEKPNGTPQTRTGHEEVEADGTVSVTWAAADKVYVTKAPGTDQCAGNLVPFSLTAGAETASATFTQDDGTSADWQNNDELYAIYGKQSQLTVTNLSGSIYADCNYTGQRQTANKGMEHLADYDFMVATGVYAEEAMPDFDFAHTGSIMKFVLTMPTDAADKKVNRLALTTEDGDRVFVSRQRVSLQGDAAADRDERVSSIDLALGNDAVTGIPTENGVLTAYLMVAPAADAALTGKRIKLSVSTTDGGYYTATLTGESIAAERLYTVTRTLTKDNAVIAVAVAPGNLVNVLKSLTLADGQNELRLVGTMQDSDLAVSDENFGDTNTSYSCSALEHWLRVHHQITTLDLSGVTGLTRIPDRAFASGYAFDRITRMILPEGITTIGERALMLYAATCNIPASVTTLKKEAFNCANLTSVIIPPGVTSIEQVAFGMTNLLRKVVIEGTDKDIFKDVNSSWLGNQMFFAGNYCNGSDSDKMVFYLPNVNDEATAKAFQEALKLTTEESYGYDTLIYYHNYPNIRYGWNSSAGGTYPLATDEAKMTDGNYTGYISCKKVEIY